MNILQCRLPENQSVYSGKELGETLAKEFMFDIVDLTKFNIEIFVPENTFAITDSFFIGLLEKTYFKIDNRELFEQKIKFILPEEDLGHRIDLLINRLEFQLTNYKKQLLWYPIENKISLNKTIRKIAKESYIKYIKNYEADNEIF